MNIEEAIKILDYKINMYKEDVYIGNLDKTNIEAIKKVLEEIERLQEELKYTIPIVEHNQTIQSNINSYNKLAEYSKELEDRIDELNNLNEKISLALESAENRIDKAIEYIEKWQSFPHTNGTTHEELRNLKDILKGSDKE